MPSLTLTSPWFNCRSTRKSHWSTTWNSARNSRSCARGVLVICSGNVVHNLHRLDFSQPASGFDWARRFDGAVRSQMTSAPQDLVALRDHKDYFAAVPTPDHFIPLLYLAGLASAGGSTAEVIVEGYVYGSQSMTCYTIDANWSEEQPAGGVRAAPHDPDLTPPNDTNA
jgi:4,5-DOPA dioxygenase extradiol